MKLNYTLKIIRDVLFIILLVFGIVYAAYIIANLILLVY